MTGVLLMAHGTPSSVDDMPEYLKLVRGGRPPSVELIAEMRANYEAIGGRSPLTELTFAQSTALQSRLGPRVPVAVGMRNWTPFIGDATRQLVDGGATRVIAVPLAPQFSTLSVAKYFAVAAASSPPGVELVQVPSYHDHPLLIAAFAAKVREAAPRSGDEVIFTAHSLPARVITQGDSYTSEVAETARRVANVASVHQYSSAFQSAGRTPEPWIGPNLDDVIREKAASGTRSFLVVPIGFVCDHTEILFDIDIQAQAAARHAGAVLRRTASLNDSPLFIDLLESLVRERL
jgi:protoporphyrin/coproporphyrin ferrochelatase